MLPQSITNPRIQWKKITTHQKVIASWKFSSLEIGPLYLRKGSSFHEDNVSHHSSSSLVAQKSTATFFSQQATMKNLH